MDLEIVSGATGRGPGAAPVALTVNGETRLPERPPISAPDDVAVEGQPRLGLLGLVLVVPIAALLALGAGGAEGSVLVLGPLVTFSLSLLAMVAFWWEDWPGTTLRPSWSGWADTVLIAAGAVVLTGLGQVAVGHLDLRGIFAPSPGAGHFPTFPATMPLAAAAFVAMLELTLVGEGWPLRALPRLPAGLLALAAAWAVALVVYFALAGMPAELGTALILIGASQALFYVVWRGWPFSLIATRSRRLACAHVVVIAAGLLTYLVVHGVMGLSTEPLAAYAACFVAAALLLGMLLEGWLNPSVTLIAAIAFAAVLALTLYAVADSLRFTRASADAWVTHVAINALTASVLLHVAVGRRWPFAAA
jgi:hypothetical protein